MRINKEFTVVLLEAAITNPHYVTIEAKSKDDHIIRFNDSHPEEWYIGLKIYVGGGF